MATPSASTELEEFLRDRPQIEFIDAMFPDLCGILRGKRLAPEHARRLYAEGLQIPASMLYLSVTGSCLDPLGRGVSDGDPDVTIHAVPGSLREIPWASRPGAQVQVSVPETGPEPGFAIDPRQILARVAGRFAELALTPVVACELEFCLIDAAPAPDGAPRPPAGGRRGTQLMSLSSVDDFAPFVEEVASVARKFPVPLTALNAEYGGDQFEVNLHHVADAVKAADDAVSLKQIVQAVAVRHGMRATFMAKPYGEKAGSGMHWHVSLVDAAGQNRFDDSTRDGQAALHHAVAGVLATLPEALAFAAPNVNSYKRFRPGLFVPMTASWGYNNRGVALRIPGGGAEDRRLEYRLPGADANPYLALAALLAGMHHGLTNALTPPPPSDGNPASKPDGSLPLRLYDALRALEEGTVLRRYLGAGYVALYAECKRLELDAFLSEPSAREFHWYLRPEA